MHHMPDILTLLAVAAGVLVLVAVAGFLALKMKILGNPAGPGADSDEPYQGVEGVLTPAEWQFYQVLRLAVGDDVLIWPKVRLADLVKVRGGLEPSQRAKAQNKINSKHVDFVIADPESGRVFGVIELDDSSHQRSKNQLRDAFVERVYGAAGIPIERVACKRQYTPEELRQVLARWKGAAGVEAAGGSQTAPDADGRLAGS
jgi:very-short-patch-repair endonuclease